MAGAEMLHYGTWPWASKDVVAAFGIKQTPNKTMVKLKGTLSSKPVLKKWYLETGKMKRTIYIFSSYCLDSKDIPSGTNFESQPSVKLAGKLAGFASEGLTGPGMFIPPLFPSYVSCKCTITQNVFSEYDLLADKSDPFSLIEGTELKSLQDVILTPVTFTPDKDKDLWITVETEFDMTLMGKSSLSADFTIDVPQWLIQST